jgi:hypothetical protein
MKNNILSSICILILSLFSISCSSSSDDMEAGGPTDTSITYNNRIKGIMSSRCNNCHGNPTEQNAPMSLTTSAQVKDAINSRGLIGEIESGSMPKNGSKLSISDINAVKSWKANGFKE